MSTLACISAILAIFALFFLYCVSNQKANTQTWPFIGILPSIILNYNRLNDKLAEILEENCGSFSLKCSLFLGRDILVTSNPADVQHIMSTKFSCYQKGSEWRKRLDIFGNSSLNTDLDEWMAQRKSIRLYFSHQKLKRLMGNVVQDCIMKELIPTLDHISEQQLVVDFQVLIKWFLSYVSFSITVDRKPKPLSIHHLEDDPLNKALDDACEAILSRHFLPVWFWKLMKKLGIGIEKKHSEAWETLDLIFARYFSICEEEISKGSDKDGNHDLGEEDFHALKLYMIGHEFGRYVPNTYSMFRDNIIALIFASGDTVSLALSWFFWLLSKNPHVEAKIRQEFEQISPVKKWDIKKFFVSNSEELNKMVYLHAALNETLRLYPPGPYEARYPVHPDTLPSGHHVNEKTTVMISVYGMGRMKSVWGEDSHEFKPERWITKDGKINHEPPHKFSAFSSGIRICPGKDFAYVLLKTFAASIMQNYHVKVVESHSVTPKSSIILQQKDGLMVRINKIVPSRD